MKGGSDSFDLSRWDSAPPVASLFPYYRMRLEILDQRSPEHFESPIMVTGTWNSDRFWTRSRNVQGAHVRRNGETIARPREESLAIVSDTRHQGPRLHALIISLRNLTPRSGIDLKSIDCRFEAGDDGRIAGTEVEWRGTNGGSNRWVRRMILFICDTCTSACLWYCLVIYRNYIWKINIIFHVRW